MTNEEKILAYALAKHLLVEESILPPEEAGVSALEVSNKIGIKKNSTDGVFKALRDKGIIIQNGKKVGKEVKYSLPLYGTTQIIEELQKKVEGKK